MQVLKPALVGQRHFRSISRELAGQRPSHLPSPGHRPGNRSVQLVLIVLPRMILQSKLWYDRNRPITTFLNNMHKYLLLLTFSFLSVAFTGCESSQSALSKPIRKTETLTPDSSLLAKLGEPQDLGFASIRIPADFTQSSKQTKGKSTIYPFTGPRRDDGTAPLLQIMTVQLGEADKARSLGVTLDKFLEGVKKRRAQWSESQLSLGMISDLEFAYKSWEGAEISRGTPMKGTMYVTYVNEKLMVAISSQDVQPMADETMPLTEAAIRTFEMK